MDKEWKESFSQGIIPERLIGDDSNFFLRLAEKMISKAPNMRVSCDYVLDKLMKYIEEKQIEIEIRIESRDITYKKKGNDVQDLGVSSNFFNSKLENGN